MIETPSMYFEPMDSPPAPTSFHAEPVLVNCERGKAPLQQSAAPFCTSCPRGGGLAAAQVPDYRRGMTWAVRGPLGCRGRTRAFLPHAFGHLRLAVLRMRRGKDGAGKGNRTPLASLEGWSITTMLYPRHSDGADAFPDRIRQPVIASVAFALPTGSVWGAAARFLQASSGFRSRSVRVPNSAPSRR